MKILRKGDKFKKVSDSTHADQKAIKTLVLDGWVFCDRATWKREVRDKGKKVEKDG
ncbi:MAG: hypothetical protein MK369_08835 [SAR202 cluster bacterium]|nr:hypothetical protein [SAR202 cluster bacterium]